MRLRTPDAFGDTDDAVQDINIHVIRCGCGHLVSAMRHEGAHASMYAHVAFAHGTEDRPTE